MKTIRIYHTNDVHSRFNELCSISTYLKTHKNQDDLLLDAGDFHDFKDIMISGTKGVAGKSILQYMGYDAICVGNNEGFSGIECLTEMSQDDIPLLSINLSHLNDTELPFLQKSCIVEKSGVRFLIIGITPFYNLENDNGYNAFFKLENLKTHDPVKRVQNEIDKYKGMVDFTIGLSHLGITFDQKIANEIKGLDIIIGGHSHTLLESPICVNQTIIYQAGCYAAHLGCLEIELEDHKIINYTGKCMAINEEKDQDLLDLIHKNTLLAKENLSQIIYSNHGLDFDPIHENSTINFICDALYKEYNCDFALINHGILSFALANGISEMSLLEACPSPLNPTLIEIKGEKIREAIQASFDINNCMAEGKGPGFRGLFVGAIGVSHNVEILQDPLIIKIDKQLLDENKSYKIMTSDYLQRGSGYPSLQVKNELSVFYAGYIRDLIKRNIHDNQLHIQSKSKRITKIIDKI